MSLNAHKQIFQEKMLPLKGTVYFKWKYGTRKEIRDHANNYKYNVLCTHTDVIIILNRLNELMYINSSVITQNRFIIQVSSSQRRYESAWEPWTRSHSLKLQSPLTKHSGRGELMLVTKKLHVKKCIRGLWQTHCFKSIHAQTLHGSYSIAALSPSIGYTDTDLEQVVQQRNTETISKNRSSEFIMNISAIYTRCRLTSLAALPIAIFRQGSTSCARGIFTFWRFLLLLIRFKRTIPSYFEESMSVCFRALDTEGIKLGIRYVRNASESTFTSAHLCQSVQRFHRNRKTVPLISRQSLSLSRVATVRFWQKNTFTLSIHFRFFQNDASDWLIRLSIILRGWRWSGGAHGRTGEKSAVHSMPQPVIWADRFSYNNYINIIFYFMEVGKSVRSAI